MESFILPIIVYSVMFIGFLVVKKCIDIDVEEFMQEYRKQEGE